MMQNDNNVFELIWMNTRAVMKMIAPYLLLSFGEQVLMQSKETVCLSQQLSKKLLLSRIKFTGGRQFVQNWIRCSFVVCFELQIAGRTTCYRHKVGVQDQAEGGWINREVQGATCC